MHDAAPLGLPAERSGRPAPPDLAARRDQMAAGVAAGAFATRAVPERVRLGGVDALRFPSPATPRGHVLQLHGGAFRIGCPEYAGPFAERLARAAGVTVTLPRYRLAPEAPFPSGLADALAALEALRGEIGAETPLIVLGDSAGGGLAASLGLLCAAGMAPRIDGLVLLSAWLDLTVSASSFTANAASDPLFGAESARIAADLYLQGQDPRHPLASPVLAGEALLTGYPPCLVSVGTGEVLLDDALRFHARLRAAGRDSRLLTVDGMDHVAVVRGAALPGSAETFAATVAFVAEACAG